MGATKLYVTYDGGNDEGFAHFQKAVISDGELNAEEIGGRLADGVLGEPRAPRSSAYPVANWSSYQWAQSALDTFIYELATQLLGRSFGTGEYSLEGAFVADLGANILMDTAPTEG